MIVSETAAGYSSLTQSKVYDLLDRLDRAYPSFNGLWRITVNEEGGVITVTNMALSNRNGFVMHIDKIDPEGRKVVRYAGELLERFRVSRGLGAMTDVLQGQRDFKGELVADHG